MTMEAALLTLLIILMVILLLAIIWLIQVVQARSGTQEAATLLQGLRGVETGVSELQTYTRARHDLERQTTESIRRLETVIAGTQSKGNAGENIIEFAFSKLPTSWQVRNFTVNNRRVEFGLRFPNGLILPIDSKWPATALVEQFALSRNPDEQRRIKDEINRVVLTKAREVEQYLSPNTTTRYGIAAVPDAVYDLSPHTQVEALKGGVVIISYSMFLPYLMLVFDTMLQSTQRVDIDRLDACLQAAQQCVQAMQDELEGRFARATTMLANSRHDLAGHLGKMSSALASVQRIG